MIVVEGPDGAGKSRLCERLSKELDWPIAQRAVGADTIPLVDMGQWLDDNIEKGFHEKIYDRHRLISEPIYGPWVRGEVGEDFRSTSRLQDWWRGFFNINPVVIFCEPSLARVMENLADDEDSQNERLRMEMPGIYWQYHCLYAQLRATGLLSNLINWDYTVDSFKLLAGWIKAAPEMHGGKRVR